MKRSPLISIKRELRRSIRAGRGGLLRVLGARKVPSHNSANFDLGFTGFFSRTVSHLHIRGASINSQGRLFNLTQLDSV